MAFLQFSVIHLLQKHRPDPEKKVESREKKKRESDNNGSLHNSFSSSVSSRETRRYRPVIPSL